MPKYDLIIVGTGFASSFFLKRYLEKSPSTVRILVLERGVVFPYQQRLKRERGEPFKLAKKTTYFANTIINNNEDKPWVFEPNFGGGSNCWTGCTPRFLPNDFKINTLYGVGQDWPITYEDLEPYYCDAEEYMGIGGPKITPFPKTRDYPLGPQKLSSVDKLIQSKYGSLYISQPTARATSPLGNRGACCSSSVCYVCPVNSKFTVENTLKWLYEDSRVEIKYNAQVISLITTNDSVKGVAYKDIENNEITEVDGEIVALGANAIFNAHILLNSNDSNKFTGKGLSEQVGTFAHLYFDGLDNVGGNSIITANGFMLYDGKHRKDYSACIIENFNDPFIRNEKGKWRKIAKMKFVFEDFPQDKNCVKTSDDLLKPIVDYDSHHEFVDKAMENLKSNIEKTFSFLPLEKIEMDGFFQKTEYHICSTTRMGESAKDSVVDKNLIHHQFRNLFVLGSGVFPSITPSNPTLTLTALSLMAANRIFY